MPTFYQIKDDNDLLEVSVPTFKEAKDLAMKYKKSSHRKKTVYVSMAGGDVSKVVFKM